MKKQIWALAVGIPLLSAPVLAVVACSATPELRGYNQDIVRRIDKLGEIDKHHETTDGVITAIVAALGTKTQPGQLQSSTWNIGNVPRVVRKIANSDDDVRVTYDLVLTATGEVLQGDHVVRIKPAAPTVAVGANEATDLTTGTITAATLDSILGSQSATLAKTTLEDKTWIATRIDKLLSGSFKINAASDIQTLTFTPASDARSGVLTLRFAAHRVYLKSATDRYQGTLETTGTTAFKIEITAFA